MKKKSLVNIEAKYPCCDTSNKNGNLCPIHNKTVWEGNFTQKRIDNLWWESHIKLLNKKVRITIEEIK